VDFAVALELGVQRIRRIRNLADVDIVEYNLIMTNFQIGI
jgi:hypothetical protein